MSMNRPDATGLRQSGKALEDSFFALENARLLKKLKEKEAAKAKREAFREIANIDNDQLIDALVELEIEPHCVAALSLVPLVEVAWADGEMHGKERGAVLRAAKQSGIEEGSPNYQLLENWLGHKPEAELLEVWKTYARALMDRLDDVIAGELKTRLMTRTTAVAKAAGGFLGIGAISDAEQAMIDQLRAAID
jgi:hypothetical protein